jgi:hypothetical protein
MPASAVRLSDPTEAGFVTSGVENDAGTIAQHGEVAEWLKAAPC